MIATIERHLSLYFKQKASIFFSLLGALIAFFLYIIFLQKNLVLSWEKSFTDPKPYLDFWIMGGVLAVTAITTSWAALSRIVSDKEQSVWDDLLLTDVSPLSLTIGYFLSGTLISLIMQGLVFVIMFTYFSWQDQLEWQSIININHLEMMEASFSGNMLAILTNKIKVIISRRYVKNLEKALGL
ncbi:LytTR family transcriptional regulator DNA-binding domain-containing protein [Streptococcus uberis]|uniref:LytTR family transcriptional regulator DNA-binding domain-containing protein n=1 Tax=Streptococcus uberis TaxID=1349 RepID=UPI003D78737A